MGLQNMLAAVSRDSGPPRLTELGKIKLGRLGEERTAQSGKKWRMPVKEDNFTITGLARDKNGDLIPDKALMERLISKYGDADKKLRQLPIRLLSDDLDRVIQARFCWYGNKTCGAVSDGETVTWRFDPKTLEPLNPPRVEDWRPDMLDMKDRAGKPIFKLHANFSCTIHSEEGRWGGVYLFRTTSVISFRQLYASLLDISEKTGGVLVGMPLWLVVRPMLVAPDGKPTNVYVVHVEVRGKDLQELQQMALAQAEFRLKFADNVRRIQDQYQRLLVAPGEESSDEAAAIEAEFSPVEHPADDDAEPPDDVLGGVADLLSGDVGTRNGRGHPSPSVSVSESQESEPAGEAPSVAQDATEPTEAQLPAEDADAVDAANRALAEAASPTPSKGNGNRKK